jgi:hypothetical protein
MRTSGLTQWGVQGDVPLQMTVNASSLTVRGLSCLSPNRTQLEARRCTSIRWCLMHAVTGVPVLCLSIERFEPSSGGFIAN